MLFHVRMVVKFPFGLDKSRAEELKSAEKKFSQDLQRQGKWIHLWRVAGTYSNISVFNVETSEELHDILWSLPLFPFMQIEVTALSRHPSAIQ